LHHNTLFWVKRITDKNKKLTYAYEENFLDMCSFLLDGPDCSGQGYAHHETASRNVEAHQHGRA
jgi:hypothetical protein